MSQLVLGIDSSTQSCKAVLVDASTGRIVDEARAAPPPARRSIPACGWSRCCAPPASSSTRLMPSPSAGSSTAWSSSKSTTRSFAMRCCGTTRHLLPQAKKIVDKLGGQQACADRIGSVMVASLTGSKLAWLKENEPDNAARVANKSHAPPTNTSTST